MKAVASGTGLSAAEGLSGAEGGSGQLPGVTLWPQGGRDPSCLYNLGRSKVVAFTLPIIKFKLVFASVTSVAQEAGILHSNNSSAV